MFDKTVDDWKRKVGDLQHELEQALADGRGNAAEVYRLKAQLDEAHDSTEAIRRENKNLSGTCVLPRPSSHRTWITLQHAHANYGTHCGQWECSHSL